MKREILIVAVALVLSVGFCSNSFGQSEISIEDLKLFRGDRIHNSLNLEVSWDYEEIPILEIMADLHAKHGFLVCLDQSAIEDSLNEDTVVNIQFQDLQMRSALRLMLDRFNATYIVRDGVLRIISKDVAKNPEFFVRKIINCKELIDQIAVAEQARKNHVLRTILPSESTEKSIDSKTSTNKESATESRATSEFGTHAEKKLIEAIKTSVAPDDWNDVNGDGTVIIVGDCLIIHQTSQAIYQVEMLLKELAVAMK